MRGVEKGLSSNKIALLNRALKTKFGSKFNGWVTDYDQEAGRVFLEDWCAESDSYREFSVGFSASDGDFTDLTIGDDLKEVVRQDAYLTADVIVDGFLSKWEETLLKMAEKVVGGNAHPVVIKQLQESGDEMVEISQLYVSPLEVDGHGETMEYEEIVGMVDNLNARIKDRGIPIKIDHEGKPLEGVEAVRAFVAECELVIGGHVVPEGTPLLKLQYSDRELWEKRKNGEFTGISIGAMAGEIVEAEIDEE